MSYLTKSAAAFSRKLVEALSPANSRLLGECPLL